jgi:protease IV
MKDSIFRSAIRAFFVTMLAVIGFFAAFVLVALGIGLLGSTASTEPTNDFTITVVADADGKRESLSTESVILKININGVIGLDGLDQHNMRQMLNESRTGDLKDNLVKAILLHIQTPGGTVIDADGIYRALKAYKEKYKVPVYAYVDGMCASGGMYIASAADKILASDVSIIGSVGVISPSAVNFSQLMDKLGLQSLTLYAGKGKDDLNPLRPWKPDEAANYKSLIDYYYGEFVHIVSSNRPQMDKEKLIKDYGANVFPANKAKELGYIDESGVSLSDAIREMAAKIGTEEGKYRVVQMTKDTWISELFKTQLRSMDGTVKHRIELTPEWDPKLMGQFLYIHR